MKRLLMTRGHGYLVVDPETKTVDYREDPKIAKLADGKPIMRRS